MNSLVSFIRLNAAVYIVVVDLTADPHSVLLRTRTQIFGQNPRTDGNSKFRIPHISELNVVHVVANEMHVLDH